jgi:hypothetical protein
MKIRSAAVAALVLTASLLTGGAAAAAPTPKIDNQPLPQAAEGVDETSRAAADCYTYVDLPDKISMDRAFTDVRVSLVDSCYASYAYFDIVGPTGYYDVLDYDPAYNGAVDYLYIDGYFTVPGTYSSPTSATDGTGYYTETVIKYGSKAGLTAKRSGGKTLLTACASYYNGNRDAFVPWQGNKATIQQQTASGQWRFVRTVTLNSSGCGSYNYANKYAGTYRVTTYETSKIWPRTSSFARS